jgi:hypothetical protein
MRFLRTHGVGLMASSGKPNSPLPAGKTTAAQPSEEGTVENAIEEPVLTYFETVQQWAELRQQIRVLQEKEKAYREQLFKGTFRDPREGANTYALPDNDVFPAGTRIVGTYKLNRTVDEEKWNALLDDPDNPLPEEIAAEVIEWKPELRLKQYRELPEEIRKRVETAIIVKPGLPDLEVKPPKHEEA